MYKFAILLLAVGSAAHAADDCRPVMDAAKKTATTPNHLFLTHVAAFRNGGKPTSSEVVTTKDRRYVLVNGKLDFSALRRCEGSQRHRCR